jgi:8-oxo-dGTP diphosphatase
MREMALLVVAAALFKEDGSVLVQRRPDGSDLAGQWEFPGGKMESGETAEMALIRELQEELDIRVKSHSLFPLGFATGKAKDRPLILLLFGSRDWIGTPKPLHAPELKWVSISELKTMPMPAADVPLIETLRHYLG